jgi:PAT family acetyl-CoA transporter-like MFS transporter 1
MKLLWSPVVDAKFLKSVGRRKSWIIPMQLIIGTTLFWISSHSEYILDRVREVYFYICALAYLSKPETKVNHLTAIFTALVFMSATQGIEP